MRIALCGSRRLVWPALFEQLWPVSKRTLRETPDEDLVGSQPGVGTYRWGMYRPLWADNLNAGGAGRILPTPRHPEDADMLPGSALLSPGRQVSAEQGFGGSAYG